MSSILQWMEAVALHQTKWAALLRYVRQKTSDDALLMALLDGLPSWAQAKQLQMLERLFPEKMRRIYEEISI